LLNSYGVFDLFWYVFYQGLSPNGLKNITLLKKYFKSKSMKKIIIYSIFLHLFIMSINPIFAQNSAQKFPAGVWRAVLQLEKTTLPFNFELSYKNNVAEVYFINGEEKLAADKILIEGDSIKIPLQLFDTELVATIKDKTITGEWRRYGLGKPYQVPFTATLQKFRFFENPQTNSNFSGTWEVDFLNDKGESSEKAVGIFKQNGTNITGTFLTTTGDYRFLEGNVNDKTLYFSTFDGSHAYRFEASLEADGTLKGDFFAGKSGYQAWKAKRNDKATLPDANSLTFLKQGYENLVFSLPNLEGKTVSLTDEKYKGKVIIVQLLGSWCPNCMDETAFLSPYYNKHKKQKKYKDLEIVGLAFERSPEIEVAKLRVGKMIQRFDIQYDVLIGGVNDKQKAAEVLPMLSSVLAFPTTIFIDKKGKVRKIHTGFSGKATGEHYTKFTDEFNLFVEKLLNE
jgi:thiol-disulfide isomerase/thioredoxin